jgi:AraC family transcriptional regulator, arabinose operon regulatory protein
MDARIRTAIQLIHNDTQHELDLAALAQEVNLSQTRFSHLFKEQTSRSPRRYRHEYRMQLAQILLECTFLRVNQIAARLGYRYAADFTRDFSKFYGHSPSATRTEAQPDKPWVVSISHEGRRCAARHPLDQHRSEIIERED